MHKVNLRWSGWYQSQFRFSLAWLCWFDQELQLENPTTSAAKPSKKIHPKSRERGTPICLCHVRASLQREPLKTLLGSDTEFLLCMLQVTSLMLLIDKLSALKKKKITTFCLSPFPLWPVLLRIQKDIASYTDCSTWIIWKCTSDPEFYRKISFVFCFNRPLFKNKTSEMFAF